MSNKVALITGGAKRIGATTARTLHQNGYRIVIHYNQSASDAESLANALNQVRPDSVRLVQGNLCDQQQLATIAARSVDQFGTIDVLINNASSFYPTPFGETSMDDWASLVGSNMMAPFFLTQNLLPELQKARGAVINMVDIHAERPLRDHTLYCMAKAALVTMTRSLAQDLAPAVRVNGVAPGAILWPERPLDGEEKQKVLDAIPMATLGNPQDIADTILFLLNAPYVTGQIIAVDGGKSVTSSSPA